MRIVTNPKGKMSILTLLVTLIVIGVVLYLVSTYIPMDAVVKRIIVIVGIILAILLVCEAFGLFDAIRGQSVPHL
jgi:hypothetical protein